MKTTVRIALMTAAAALTAVMAMSTAAAVGDVTDMVCKAKAMGVCIAWGPQTEVDPPVCIPSECKRVPIRKPL